MPQPRRGFFQNAARQVQTGGAVSIALRFIRMALSHEQVVTRFHLLGLDPCSPSETEFGKMVTHAEKLSPQEQWATALGFVTLNPPFWRSSLKSSSDPLTKSALFGSTTTRT